MAGDIVIQIPVSLSPSSLSPVTGNYSLTHDYYKVAYQDWWVHSHRVITTTQPALPTDGALPYWPHSAAILYSGGATLPAAPPGYRLAEVRIGALPTAVFQFQCVSNPVASIGVPVGFMGSVAINQAGGGFNYGYMEPFTWAQTAGTLYQSSNMGDAGANYLFYDRPNNGVAATWDNATLGDYVYGGTKSPPVLYEPTKPIAIQAMAMAGFSYSPVNIGEIYYAPLKVWWERLVDHPSYNSPGADDVFGPHVYGVYLNDAGTYSRTGVAGAFDEYRDWPEHARYPEPDAIGMVNVAQTGSWSLALSRYLINITLTFRPITIALGGVSLVRDYTKQLMSIVTWFGGSLHCLLYDDRDDWTPDDMVATIDFANCSQPSFYMKEHYVEGTYLKGPNILEIHAMYARSYTHGRDWVVEIIPGSTGYEGLTSDYQRTRIILAGFKPDPNPSITWGNWYVQVGSLIDGGSYQWSVPVDTGIVASNGSGCLRTREDGVMELLFIDVTGNVKIARCDSLATDGTGVWV